MRMLLLLLALMACFGRSEAQNCSVDSNLLNYPTTVLLSPAPYSPDTPFYNLALACVNEPYGQSVTVKVPPNLLIATIDSVVVPKTGAIANLPAGLSYVCNPPSCKYLPNTLGCILLTGTPTAANNAPDTFDLLITATIYTNFLNQTLQLPSGLSPEQHFYLIVQPSGTCISSAPDASGPVADLTLAPNPTYDIVSIQARVLESGAYRLQVFDLMGRLQWEQHTALGSGENTINQSFGFLQSGQYFLVLSNKDGRMTRRLVVR